MPRAPLDTARYRVPRRRFVRPPRRGARHPHTARRHSIATRTIPPRQRRHGLTPRATSSRAQTARHTRPATRRTGPARPEGATIHPIAAMAPKSPKGRLGHCAMTIAPSRRSRKNQSRSRLTTRRTPIPVRPRAQASADDAPSVYPCRSPRREDRILSVRHPRASSGAGARGDHPCPATNRYPASRSA